MKRRYQPDPTRQRCAAHRRRKAYGRALHQVCGARGYGFSPAAMHVPRIVRQHASKLRALLLD